MENFIDHISILNFKSIRELKLEGLSRINLFIGKPNVGKSNILEAFGVFSLPFLRYNSNRKLSSLIRFKYETELFNDGNVGNEISISTNQAEFNVLFKDHQVLGLDLGVNSIGYGTINRKNLLIKLLIKDSMIAIEPDAQFKISFTKIPANIFDSITPIKKFDFVQDANQKNVKQNCLIPPNGVNLFNIIENTSVLKAEIKSMFEEYGLILVFDKASQELKISKPPKNNEIFLIPYSSIADTLQRIIFYKTAIVSNQNSVLIFEEPEAHAFPPYISHVTQEIIDSKSNQFILSTHSPYVLNDFLENARDELSIFMVDYKNGETVVNKLTKEDLDDIYGYGLTYSPTTKHL